MSLNPTGGFLRAFCSLGSRLFYLARDPLAKAGPVEIHPREISKVFSRVACFGVIGHTDVAASLQRALFGPGTQDLYSFSHVFLIFYARPIHVVFISIHG